MKSQIKDIVIGIFAVIGFSAIVMSFNTPTTEKGSWYVTPSSSTSVTPYAYIHNDETGEVWLLDYDDKTLVKEKVKKK